MLCKHSFIKSADVSKPRPETHGMHRGIAGVEAICINCGQVRRAYIDGSVEIRELGEGPIDPNNEEDHVSASGT